MNKKNYTRNILLIFITFGVIIDNALAIFYSGYSYSYFSDFCRPIVVLIMLTSVRSNLEMVV